MPATAARSPDPVALPPGWTHARSEYRWRMQVGLYSVTATVDVEQGLVRSHFVQCRSPGAVFPVDVPPSCMVVVFDALAALMRHLGGAS